jgi:DNA-binding response OmpR family regulator
MSHPLIAIVEDELPIQRLYKTKLELEGFRVATANNGSEGLRVIKAEKPDLVLLDLRMPGMNGDEMLVKLRQTEWGAGIRVIILTNVSRDEAPAQLRFLGVSRYIVKAHHTPAQLVAIIYEILGKKPHHNR